MLKQQLPAYPLFVKDPFFSVWSPTTELNGSNTMFWNGETRPAYGIVTANGSSYCFMGDLPHAEKLSQTSVSLTAFSTDYSFSAEAFDLTVSFLSPLLPDDLTVLSMPVCYLSYKLTPKQPLTDVTVSLWLDERHCYDRKRAEVRGGVLRFPGYEAGWFGRRRQLPLSHAGDSFAADWGYTYLAAEASWFVSGTALNSYLKTGTIEYFLDSDERRYLAACNSYARVTAPVEGKILIAFDDVSSIYYFGDVLKGYYFSNGKTVLDAIADGYAQYPLILQKTNDFDQKLRQAAAKHGDKYYHVLTAALRQAVGAHKLVKDKDGSVLFLSKECHSNGCIATVDISYPSAPLFLLYAPELVSGMLRPIFQFAALPVWKFDYAPHDAGTYPYCLGQTYSLQENADKYHAGSVFMKPDGSAETYPPYYTFPANCDIYTEQYQMPIEECSNMLILSAAAVKCGADEALYRENLPLLTQWAEYLVKNGLEPFDQPCTDDFAEHLEKNVNLSVKAIVGIAAFSILAEKLKKNKLASDMMKTARSYAEAWRQKCASCGTHTPITFDSGADTFSLKYNMAFDVLFGTELFPQSVREAETDCYLARANRFGTPLDNRASYSKTDWLLWTAGLTESAEKERKFISMLDTLLRECPTKVPFTDWYDTVTGKQISFQNRSVQGGLFLLLLKDSGKLLIK